MFTKHNLELLLYVFCVGKKNPLVAKQSGSLLSFELILLFSLIMLVAKPQTSEGNKKGNDKMHVLDYVYM